jgi:hypothetical protein
MNTTGGFKEFQELMRRIINKKDGALEVSTKRDA